MTDLSNDYAYWENALSGKYGPVHDGDPQCGFYRKKVSKTNYVPVAIWREDNVIVATVNDAAADASEIWTWVCQNPVTYEAYQARVSNGQWPDDVPQTPTIGHNAPVDPHEAFRLDLDAEREAAEQFMATPIESQEDADKAASWARKIGDIAKKADVERTVEKEPHLKAGREVDDKWRDVIAAGKDLAARLKRHIEPFLLAQKRKADEERRMAAAEAERLRLAAAEADQKSERERIELIEAAQKAERESKPTGTSAGRTGAKVALRTEKRARIVDYDKAVEALKSHPEMRELVDRLANRAVKAGIAVDGVEVEEIQKVV